MISASGSPDRIASLDLLRVAAALAVVAFHYLWRDAVVHGAPEAALAPALFGYLGVNLFFLISGYVIALSAEGRDAWSFAAARFSRIYPGFVAALAISFIVLWLAADPRFPVSPAQFLANLAILSPALGQPFVDGVYWSIVLELAFYGWVALAIQAGIFDRHRRILVAAWLAIAALNETWLQNSSLRMLFVTEYAGLFAAGMLLQAMRRSGADRASLALLALAFVHSTAAMGVTQGWMVEHYGAALGWPELMAANVAIHALFVVAMTVRVTRAQRLIATLGALTYPLYLLHQNIGYVLIDRATPHLGHAASVASAFAVTLVLSWLVWRLVERPLGGRLRGGLIEAGSMVATAATRLRDGRRGALSDAPPAT